MVEEAGRGNSLELILEASEQCFERYGYHATSIRQIANAVGLQPGSLYAHIQSKNDLLYEITKRVATRFLDASESARIMSGSPTEQLRAFAQGHLGVIGRNPRMANVLILEWRSLPEDRREEIGAMRAAHERNLTEIVRDGQLTGEFVDVDEKWIRFMLLSSMNWVGQWFNPSGPNTAEDIADAFVDIALRGIAGPNPRATTQRTR